MGVEADALLHGQPARQLEQCVRAVQGPNERMCCCCCIVVLSVVMGHAVQRARCNRIPSRLVLLLCGLAFLQRSPCSSCC